MNDSHDKFLKERLQDINNAIDFLKLGIPEDDLNKIKIDTLHHIPTTFVDENLKGLFSDIVFECELQDGRKAYCTIIIEHKSAQDPLAGFQLLKYLTACYSNQTKDVRNLKVCIPILFSHAEGGFKYRSIESFFEDISPELLRFVPKFDIIIFDLTDIADEVIYSIRNIAVSSMLMTQKYIHNPVEMMIRLGKIFETLKTEGERNNFKSTFVYISYVVKKKVNFIELLKKDINKPLNQYFMTLIEQYEAMVKEEGKLEGKIEIILKSYDNDLTLSLISNITGLSEEEVTKILKENGREV
jgi:recombination-promoting nuclease RpnB